MRRTKADLEKEIEQLRVQLAGCSCVALGETSKTAKKGDYGWSPAYQDVLDLRIKFDILEAKSNQESRHIEDREVYARSGFCKIRW